VKVRLKDFIKRKKKVIYIIALLVVLFLAFLGSVVYTERPEFCKTCHLMKPYYKAWKESAHRDVHCLDCHYEPNWKSHLKGKINGLVQVIDYVTGRYSEKPMAKISDASCLRQGCHDKEKLKVKKIMFKNKVEFRHSTHWREFADLGESVQLRCATCHMWLTFDKHIAVDENTCLICHFKNVPVKQLTTQCLTCHTDLKKDSEHQQYMQEGLVCTECHTTIKTTDAPVLKQMCYFCHADKEKIEKVKDRELLHKRHISKNKADCINCHELIKHGKE
jgi:nitrate/TMAO reductase-like tetraheme cytochrome c subunit